MISPNLSNIKKLFKQPMVMVMVILYVASSINIISFVKLNKDFFSIINKDGRKCG